MPVQVIPTELFHLAYHFLFVRKGFIASIGIQFNIFICFPHS